MDGLIWDCPKCGHPEYASSQARMREKVGGHLCPDQEEDS